MSSFLTASHTKRCINVFLCVSYKCIYSAYNLCFLRLWVDSALPETWHVLYFWLSVLSYHIQAPPKTPVRNPHTSLTTRMNSSSAHTMIESIAELGKRTHHLHIIACAACLLALHFVLLWFEPVNRVIFTTGYLRISFNNMF